jgi:uncharacterized membrane protein
MDAAARELLDLVLRWIHVVAGIMWIGNSLLFNWLDRNLVPARAPRDESRGEIWLLHSGAFYFVEKEVSGWDRERTLHWFKWQAYTTWMTGAALLVIVYYLSGGALLVDPASGLSPAQGAALSVGILLGAWLAYDLALSRLLTRAGGAGAVLGLVLVTGVAYGLEQVFTGRAAYLHVGALLGTLMAGNVFRVIMPSQRGLVAAVEGGSAPDLRLSDRAKERSIHNNYMTFPVVVLMVSSHFPGLYGHRWSWVLLAIVVAAGAAVRHLMNVRFTYRAWLPALGATGVAAFAALYLLTARPGAGRPASGAPLDKPATAEAAHAIVLQRCTVCHATSPADRTFGPAPGGAVLETPEQMRAWAERIRVRAVETETMPPANKTWMTADEREVLRRWIAAGAAVPGD